jgi:hypothetical protein
MAYLELETQELLARMDSKFKKLSHCAERVILPDGRLCEIQIVATCINTEFCKEIDKMTAWTY